MMAGEKQISKPDWLYFDDRPVGLRGDLLWCGNEEADLDQQIREVAQRIVAPLREGDPGLASESLVFAIHGRWGSGKSSVLNMIQDEANKQAGDASTRLKFCEYLATVHENIERQPKPTMVMRILLALADRNYQQALGQYWETIQAEEPQNEQGKLPSAGAQPSRNTVPMQRFQQLVEKLARDVAELVDVQHFLQPLLVPRNDESRVVAVMIDDLDRCNPDFVGRVLDTVLQLSSVPNLFFLLAVDREQLKRAVEKQYREIVPEGNPYYAMEKYVQHTLTIPEMTEEQVKTFVVELLKDYTQDRFSQLISEEAGYLASGLRNRTPRTIKRCLNTIRPAVQRQIRALTGRGERDRELDNPLASNERVREDLRRGIKQQVLAYSWPDFYHAFFLPGWMGERPYHAALDAIEAACVEYGGRDDPDEDLLRFQVKRITEQLRRPELQEFMSPALARYLALPPYWLVAQDGGGGNGGLGFHERLARVVSVDEAKAGTLPEDQRTLLQRLYTRCEGADFRGDREATRSYAVQIFELVSQQKEHFGANEAPRVGNVAVNAEALGDRTLAAALYELALELDPNHANNIQNYVDFIVKSQTERLYGLADELLSRLERDERLQRHLPQRTLALRAALARLRNEALPENIRELLGEQVERFKASPTDRRAFVALMGLLPELGEYDTMTEVARLFYQRASSEEERYLALRGLADQLAESNELRNESRAMDTYRFLLDQGSREGTVDQAQQMHNYASLLYKHDYNRQAGELWHSAYGIAPNAGNIQRAYSNYLLAAHRPDLAELVTDGRPVEEVVLQESTKEVPARFSDEDPLRLFSPPSERRPDASGPG